MGIFSSILSKIFHHADAPSPAASGTSPAASGSSATAAPTPAIAPSPGSDAANTSGSATPATLGQADVEKILTDLAAKKGGGGNWQTSIVDLLRLLDLDPSLNARKELATELNVHVGEHGSAEQNIALSKAVWQQLAQNGGKVPDSLKN